MTWRQSLDAKLHRRQLSYCTGPHRLRTLFRCPQPEGQHGAMSVTKTFVGTLAAILAPRRAGPSNASLSMFPSSPHQLSAAQTVRQVMDMTTGIKFSENYADPSAEVWRTEPPATVTQAEGLHGPALLLRVPAVREAGGRTRRSVPLPHRQHRCAGLDTGPRYGQDCGAVCSPSASGSRWAQSRTPICRWTRSARHLRAAA